MTKIIWGLMLLCLTTACGRGFDKKNFEHAGRTQESQEVDTYSVNQDYLLLVNEYRIDKGLKPLLYQPLIEEFSKKHSKSMATRARPVGHMGLGARCRFLKNRLGKVKKCTELVSMGPAEMKSLLSAWLSSPTYRVEFDNPSFTHTGLGMYKDKLGVIYWTQMFIELK